MIACNAIDKLIELERRQWVGLTIEEIHKAVVDTGIHVFEGDIYKFVNALEEVLREKNT